MTEAEKIDHLAEVWSKLELEEIKIKERKRTALGEILALVDQPPDRGTVNLEGETKKVALTFRENVSYSDKEELERLVLSIPNGEDMFRMELKERTAKVEDFLRSTKGEDVDKLLLIRKVKQGSTGIKISNRKI